MRSDTPECGATQSSHMVILQTMQGARFSNQRRVDWRPMALPTEKSSAATVFSHHSTRTIVN